MTVPLSLGLGEGLSCGRDACLSVTSEYGAPFAFTGRIYKVEVDVSGELIEDKNAEMRQILTRQ